jgi:tryptophan-rich sensory protein
LALRSGLIFANLPPITKSQGWDSDNDAVRAEALVSEIASKGQLRLSLLRWAMVTVPAVMFLGLVSGLGARGGANDRWYDALAKSAQTPPDVTFALVWPLLYLLLGLSLAIILNARSAQGRGIALAFFAAQFVCNLVWSPLFFGAHQVTLAFYLAVAIFLLAVVTAVLFGRVRPLAAWLLVPYLCWLGFASGLAYDVHRLNPDAESLVPAAAHSQI